jgi:hypothetical protein
MDPQRGGHHQQAVFCYRQALELYCDLGQYVAAAETLIRLGDTHIAAGDRTSAHDAWIQAVNILGELDHPDADHVRVKLDRGSHPG